MCKDELGYLTCARKEGSTQKVMGTFQKDIEASSKEPSNLGHHVSIKMNDRNEYNLLKQEKDSWIHTNTNRNKMKGGKGKALLYN